MLLLAACDPSRCDIAVDEINNIADGCPGVDTREQDAGLDCTDADAEELERQAACMAEASCSAIDGSDPAEHAVFSLCVATPVEAEE